MVLALMAKVRSLSHQVDAGEDGRFVVRGCEVQLLALQTEEETIKNGQTVFGGNHSAQGLKAL